MMVGDGVAYGSARVPRALHPAAELGPGMAAQSCPDVAGPSRRGMQDQRASSRDSKSPKGEGSQLRRPAGPASRTAAGKTEAKGGCF